MVCHGKIVQSRTWRLDRSDSAYDEQKIPFILGLMFKKNLTGETYYGNARRGVRY